MAKKLSRTNLIEALPEPWQEHYDEQYKRCYYYNPQTKQSSWERPQAQPPTAAIPKPTPQSLARSPRIPGKENIRGRPLPALPGSVDTTSGSDSANKARRMSDVSGSVTSRQRRAQQPLPAIPDKEDSSKLSQRRKTENKRSVVRNNPEIKEVPQIPSKDVSQPPGRGRGALPSLPPKEGDLSNYIGPIPTNKSHSKSPNLGRQPVPIPGKLQAQEKETTNRFRKSFVPTLPPKEPSTIPSLPPKEPEKKNPIPSLPPKEPEKKSFIPSLPPKEQEKALPPMPQRQTNGNIPPLPMKESSSPTPETEKPVPHLPPKPQGPSSVPNVTSTPPVAKKGRKHIVEYEDFPIRQPPKSKTKTEVPELPEKMPAPAAAPPPPQLPVTNGAPPTLPVMNGNGAPSPPPPPPVGVPVPPPPPPNAPPSPLPTAQKAPPNRNQSSSSDEGGRPFTANDLAQAKTLLKKRKEVPEEDRRNPGASSGIAGVFANAIDSRMTSIRKAMVDSDSEESEFEDIDDDDEWD